MSELAAEDLWGLRAHEVVGQHFLNLDIGLPFEQLRPLLREVLGEQSGPADPVASIVIPVHGQLQHTLACLQALADHPPAAAVEVLVVDDASPDGTAAALAGIAGLRLHVRASNGGFVAACNDGAALARGATLVFLNNDTVPQPGWLDALLATFDTHPGAGLVGAQLLYPDGRLQESGGVVFEDGSAWNYGRFGSPADPRHAFVRDADYCSGAAIALPRALFETVVGFDVRYAPAYYEDTDLAFKVRAAGRRVLVQPAARVVHDEGTTAGTDTGSGAKAYQVGNRATFAGRWRDALAQQLPPSADSIEGELARFLQKATGVALSATAFDPAAIEPHLHANLRLMESVAVLEESRDLAGLRERFGARAAAAFARHAAQGMARTGLVAFPVEPVPEQVPGAGGVPAYPALHDEGDSAALAVHADPEVARRAHPAGVRRLIRIALADRLKQARKQLPVQAKTALLHAAIESAAPRAAARGGDTLRDDLVDGAFAALTDDGLAGIRDADSFAARSETVARALFPEAMSRLQQAEKILALVAEARIALDARLVGWASGNLDDMQAQLAELVPPGFLRQTPAGVLAEYPRYLRALVLRAERALRDPVRDQARMLELKPFTDALEDAADAGELGDPEWQALRWDLEELRVSLFAQELGARGGVSLKKLAARLKTMQDRRQRR